MKKQAEPTPQIAVRTEREETGVMDAKIVQQLREVAMPHPAEQVWAGPEHTELVPAAQQHALQRLTRDERDSDVVTSAPKKPVEATPAGLPGGDSEELHLGGVMDIKPTNPRAEATEHLGQNDIIGEELDPDAAWRSWNTLRQQDEQEEEQTSIYRPPHKARDQEREPEATMMPGHDFLNQLEQDRQRRGGGIRLNAPLELVSALERVEGRAQAGAHPARARRRWMVMLVLGLLVWVGFLITR